MAPCGCSGGQPVTHPATTTHQRLSDEVREAPEVQPPWNLRLRTPELLKNPLQSWIEDDAFDLDYHVRHSALPAPGRVRELFVLISRLPVSAILVGLGVLLVTGAAGGVGSVVVRKRTNPTYTEASAFDP